MHLALWCALRFVIDGGIYGRADPLSCITSLAYSNYASVASLRCMHFCCLKGGLGVVAEQWAIKDFRNRREHKIFSDSFEVGDQQW